MTPAYQYRAKAAELLALAGAEK